MNMPVPFWGILFGLALFFTLGSTLCRTVPLDPDLSLSNCSKRQSSFSLWSLGQDSQCYFIFFWVVFLSSKNLNIIWPVMEFILHLNFIDLFDWQEIFNSYLLSLGSSIGKTFLITKIFVLPSFCSELKKF